MVALAVDREAQQQHLIQAELVTLQPNLQVKETMVASVRQSQDLEAVEVVVVHPQSGLLEHLVAVETAVLERHPQ